MRFSRFLVIMSVAVLVVSSIVPAQARDKLNPDFEALVDRYRIVEELASRGIRPPADRLRRVYGPAGLDVGSETPEEIALSIVTEIRAVLSGRAAGFLRDRHGPLHDGPVS